MEVVLFGQPLLFGASKSTNKEQNIAHPKPKEKLIFQHIKVYTYTRDF